MESDEEVLVVNNLSLEEDVSCPMPDVNPFRDIDREGHTDQISRAGMAEQVVTKRSCLRNRADSARPRDPGVRRERPSCKDRREAASSAVGRNLTMGESGMIDDTEQRDVSAVVALNLESTAKEYEYGDRRRIQGTRVLSTDSQVPRKKKSGDARRKRKRQPELAAMAHETENDPLQEIDLSEAGLSQPQKAELVTLLEEFRDIFTRNLK